MSADIILYVVFGILIVVVLFMVILILSISKLQDSLIEDLISIKNNKDGEKDG